MKALRLFFMLCSLSALISCRHESELTESQRNRIIDEITEMAIQFFVDSEAKNLEAVLSYLDNTEKFYWVFPPDPTPVSRDDLAALLKTEMETNNSVVSTWEEVRIEPLANDLAYYQGRFRQVVTDSAGSTAEFMGIESAMVVLREDGWKFMTGQTYFTHLKSE
jgi:hypothetical protein